MIGTRIGPLEIKQKLGEGGMGMVFLAEHVVLRSPRVVKVLLPELTRNPMVVQRFINEARAAASIQHRTIISVLDVGQLPDNNWYIVLEYLAGETLRDFAKKGQPLAPPVALQILVQIANGLGAAHAQGIIHRDLKPDNIFLTTRDANERHVVILDFGIAKLSEQTQSSSMTHTGQAIGTPAYMSPEQLRGAKIDQTCDVYALGVIAYQMMTGGRLPFEDASSAGAGYDVPSAEIYHRQLTRLPDDPRAFAPGVPEGWVKAIFAALDREPAKRPQTARGFVLALAEATPNDGYGKDGIGIVRTYAPELLEFDELLETVRGPMPVRHSLSKPPSIPPSQPPSVTVAGKYQLGSQLGAGGMAEVFLGSVVGAEGFSRQVAIKRVLPGYSQVPAFATMFVDEARIASQLSHPNIVTVLDFDRDPEGRLFLVMEYVDGKDLSALLVGGPLPPAIAAFVTTEVLRGLGCAHELPNPQSGMRGVIHRDVSPHNVLLSWEGAVKVSDFGIAKAFEGSGGVKTEQIKGKAAYMSPEQANGEKLDGRSDLFAVGIMLWEALTGHRLFAADSTKAELAKVFFAPIPLPSSVRSGIPRDLEAVAMKLLARDLAARYASAEHAISDLARCADHPRDGRGDLVRLLQGRFPIEVRARSRKPAPRRAVAQLTAFPSTLGSAASQALPTAAGGRRWVVPLGGFVILAVIALGIVLGLRATERRSASPGSDAMVATITPDATTSIPLGQLPDAAVITTPSTDALAVVPDAASDASVSGAHDAGVIDAVVPRHDAGTVAAKPPAFGAVTVKVIPWAEVTIDRKGFGQTPVRATLSPGRHRVTIANDALSKQETIEITVVAGKSGLIERNWKP